MGEVFVDRRAALGLFDGKIDWIRNIHEPGRLIACYPVFEWCFMAVLRT